MPVRKTESRLPFDLSPEELGQAASAADGKSALVSFLSAPVVTGRLQQYIVFVTDGALAGEVQSYQWQMINGPAETSENTSAGYLEYVPSEAGGLTVSVALKGNAGQTLVTLNLQQDVTGLNPALETLLDREDTSAPVAGHPETSRELINDLRAYIDEIAPRDSDANSTLNRLLFSMAYHEVLRQPAAERAEKLELIAESLSGDDKAEFLDQAENGIGICRVQPQVLAMYFHGGGSSPLLTPRVLPAEPDRRITLKNTLLEEFGNLDLNVLVDLFNILRFPKSNLKMCKLLFDALRDQYYSGQTYEDVFGDRDKGTKLIDQYKEGPFALT